MIQIERTKVVTYRWWRDGGGAVKPEHVPALEERADERIAEMMAEGYTSGELLDNIHMAEDDPEDGVAYRGWWELSKLSDDAAIYIQSLPGQPA